MTPLTFNTIEELFAHLRARGGANPQRHGALGTFYAQMTVYTNPNTCSCKKGKKARDMILATARTIGSVTGEIRDNCLALFDGNGMILNSDGGELARL